MGKFAFGGILAILSFLVLFFSFQKNLVVIQKRKLASISNLPPFVNSTFQYEDLIKIIDPKIQNETQIPKTVDAFLNKLPDDFMNSFTLVYNSGSTLQKGSFQEPRAIVFGVNARLVIAYTSANQKGGNNIEILYWNDNQQSYEAREIIFASGKTPQLSKANPAKCQECHVSELGVQPIWENYDFWPGVYGSHDDNLWVSSEEWDNLQKFRKALANKSKNTSRYVKLFKYARSDAFPYYYKKSRDKSDIEVFDEFPEGRNDFNSPNTRLSNLFANLQARKVYKKISVHQDYKQLGLLWLIVNSYSCLEPFVEELKKELHPETISHIEKKWGNDPSSYLKEALLAKMKSAPKNLTLAPNQEALLEYVYNAFGFSRLDVSLFESLKLQKEIYASSRGDEYDYRSGNRPVHTFVSPLIRQDLFSKATYFPQLQENLLTQNVVFSSELTDILIEKMKLLPRLDLLCSNVTKEDLIESAHLRELFDRSKEVVIPLLEKK